MVLILPAACSAGGHIAACTAVVPGLEEPGEDTSVSAVPNTAVLFNPALVLAPLGETNSARFPSRVNAERMGVEPRRISPAHHVRAGAPPMIIFHGKADTTVPFVTAEAFTARMKAAGNRCELVGFDGQPHGFFNYGRGDNRFFRETLKQADECLASLGYLAGPPQVDKFLNP